MLIDIEKVQGKAQRYIRRKWLQRGLKEVSNNDNHDGLEKIYRIIDPWNLDCPREHMRFVLTNREIEKRFGKVGRMLEIGCSEGLQSTYLNKLCESLDGIEVSPTALARAKRRLPTANFHLGDLSQQPWKDETDRYDLVVACEVLYYVSDVKSMLQTMNRIGKACFVTFFTPEAHKLTEIVESIPGVEKDWISHDNTTWLIASWRNVRNAVAALAGMLLTPLEYLMPAAAII
jgi:2-polyprenyl-3-methyl-5-hydroxy-6-metoxy-1,4-benzoquinol methylase